KARCQQYTSGGASVLDLDSTTVLATGTWYHVACTVSGSTATVYINGVPEATATRSGTPGTSTDPLYIGYGATAGTYFPGSVDDVRVYKRALGASDAAALGRGFQPGTSLATQTFGAVTVTNNLTLAAGTIANGTSAISLAGSFYNFGGVLSLGTGTFTLNGTG